MDRVRGFKESEGEEMKTSEFINKVEGLGYQTYACEFWIDVIDRFGLKGTVFTKDFKLALSTNDINLIKLCLEYTVTPFKDREGEKKYTVILPDSRINGEGKMITLKRNWEDRVVLSYSQIENIERYSLYHLTEAEIKRNHEYLWQFAKEVQE